MFSTTYDSLKYENEKEPIDFNKIVTYNPNITFFDWKIEQIYPFSYDMLSTMLYMLENGAQCTPLTWKWLLINYSRFRYSRLRFMDPIFKSILPRTVLDNQPEDVSFEYKNAEEEVDIKLVHHIILICIEQGMDPFIGATGGELPYLFRHQDLNFMLQLLDYPQISRDSRTALYFTEDTKDKIRKLILDQAVPLLQADQFDYFLVCKILEESFYIGSIEYKDTCKTIQIMAQRIHKIDIENWDLIP